MPPLRRTHDRGPGGSRPHQAVRSASRAVGLHAGPAGRVIGLVGPNGAGETTLLHLACGLPKPTSGTVSVLGAPPASGPEQLARIGFVAQDTPTYPGLSIEDHLGLGAHLNSRWDKALAQRRVASLGLDPRQRAGKLSGGQRAQLALTMARHLRRRHPDARDRLLPATRGAGY